MLLDVQKGPVRIRSGQTNVILTRLKIVKISAKVLGFICLLYDMVI
jgi:hypothetical protein